MQSLEEHITVSHDTSIDYSLVSKNNLPEGFEELSALEDSTCSSAAANNVSGAKDISPPASVPHSSDSDAGKFVVFFCSCHLVLSDCVFLSCLLESGKKNERFVDCYVCSNIIVKCFQCCQFYFKYWQLIF